MAISAYSDFGSAASSDAGAETISARFNEIPADAVSKVAFIASSTAMDIIAGAPAIGILVSAFTGALPNAITAAIQHAVARRILRF